VNDELLNRLTHEAMGAKYSSKCSFYEYGIGHISGCHCCRRKKLRYWPPCDEQGHLLAIDFMKDKNWVDTFEWAKDDTKHDKPVEVTCWECDGEGQWWASKDVTGVA
jgi:hypothetical protein